MLKKVYVTASSRKRAQEVADYLAMLAFEVVSEWHSDPRPAQTKEGQTEHRAQRKTNIERADFVVLAAGGNINGSKFWEAGMAEGMGKPVVLISDEGAKRHESVMTWGIPVCNSPDLVRETLRKAGYKA